MTLPMYPLEKQLMYQWQALLFLTEENKRL